MSLRFSRRHLLGGLGAAGLLSLGGGRMRRASAASGKPPLVGSPSFGSPPFYMNEGAEGITRLTSFERRQLDGGAPAAAADDHDNEHEDTFLVRRASSFQALVHLSRGFVRVRLAVRGQRSQCSFLRFGIRAPRSEANHKSLFELFQMLK